MYDQELRAILLAQARAGGCTCEPDITLPRIERGQLRVASVAHDNDCPRATNDELNSLVERINRGEFDR
jgi:hypothetical protein